MPIGYVMLKINMKTGIASVVSRSMLQVTYAL